MKKSNIIYPWDDKKFDGPVEDLNSVYYNLKKLGYKIDKKKPQDQKIFRAIEKIIPLLLEDKWLFLYSNSGWLLSVLANLIPVIYSLTTKYSCINTTTDTLYNLALKENFDDISYSDLQNIKLSTLLFWNNIIQARPQVSKYSGCFFDVLNFRFERACSTIFTHLYTGKKTDILVRILEDKISELFGDSFLALLKEKVVVLDINILEKSTWNNQESMHL